MSTSVIRSLNQAVDGWLLDCKHESQTGANWFAVIHQATRDFCKTHDEVPWERDVAYDVFQLIFEKGPESRIFKTFDPQKGNFVNYLFRTSDYTLHTYYRKLSNLKITYESIPNHLIADHRVPSKEEVDRGYRDVFEYVENLVLSKVEVPQRLLFKTVLHNLWRLRIEHTDHKGQWTHALSDTAFVRHVSTTTGTDEMVIRNTFKTIRSILKSEKVVEPNHRIRMLRRRQVFHNRSAYRRCPIDREWRLHLSRAVMTLKDHPVTLLRPSIRSQYLRIGFKSELPMTPQQVDLKLDTGYVSTCETSWQGLPESLVGNSGDHFTEFRRIINASKLGLKAFPRTRPPR